MKGKWLLWLVAALIGTVLAFPPLIISAAEKAEEKAVKGEKAKGEGEKTKGEKGEKTKGEKGEKTKGEKGAKGEK